MQSPVRTVTMIMHSNIHLQRLWKRTETNLMEIVRSGAAEKSAAFGDAGIGVKLL